MWPSLDLDVQYICIYGLRHYVSHSTATHSWFHYITRAAGRDALDTQICTFFHDISQQKSSILGCSPHLVPIKLTLLLNRTQAVQYISAFDKTYTIVFFLNPNLFMEETTVISYGPLRQVEKKKMHRQPRSFQFTLGGSRICFHILWAHMEEQHLGQGHDKTHSSCSSDWSKDLSITALLLQPTRSHCEMC